MIGLQRASWGHAVYEVRQDVAAHDPQPHRKEAASGSHSVGYGSRKSAVEEHLVKQHLVAEDIGSAMKDRVYTSEGPSSSAFRGTASRGRGRARARAPRPGGAAPGLRARERLPRDRARDPGAAHRGDGHTP